MGVAMETKIFPFLLGRAFIEAAWGLGDESLREGISLPSGKGFH